MEKEPHFLNRLSGWWGSDKTSRFAMTNAFQPTPGASGFQLSNPSVLDITSLCSSLTIFSLAGGISSLRKKSLLLTSYLETLLLNSPIYSAGVFRIITPSNKEERGAQLSLKLEEGLLDVVMRELEERGVVVDERRPDVIRVAPVPLYNSFGDVWEFVWAFVEAVGVAMEARDEGRQEGEDEESRELEMTT
jgi:kynureninase